MSRHFPSYPAMSTKHTYLATSFTEPLGQQARISVHQCEPEFYLHYGEQPLALELRTAGNRKLDTQGQPVSHRYLLPAVEPESGYRFQLELECPTVPVQDSPYLGTITPQTGTVCFKDSNWLVPSNDSQRRWLKDQQPSKPGFLIRKLWRSDSSDLRYPPLIGELSQGEREELRHKPLWLWGLEAHKGIFPALVPPIALETISPELAQWFVIGNLPLWTTLSQLSNLAQKLEFPPAAMAYQLVLENNQVRRFITPNKKLPDEKVLETRERFFDMLLNLTLVP